MTPTTVDNVFLSVQGAMEDCLKDNRGENASPLRHTSKAKLRRQGQLPTSIKCDPSLIAVENEIFDMGDKWVREQQAILDAKKAAAAAAADNSDSENDELPAENYLVPHEAVLASQDEEFNEDAAIAAINEAAAA